MWKSGPEDDYWSQLLGDTLGGSENDKRWATYPLLHYAAHHWALHAGRARTSALDVNLVLQVASWRATAPCLNWLKLALDDVFDISFDRVHLAFTLVVVAK